MSLLKNLKSDILPGIVVFLVALPLCLGIAHASGAPLMSGVISGIIGGIIVGLFSKSNSSVSGPAAGLTAIVLAAIQESPSFEGFLVAVVLAGLIQMAMGLLKMGGITDFFPSYIIKGLLAAIGIILILKQIPHTVGYDADNEGDFYFQQADGHNTLSEFLYLSSYVHFGVILTTLLSFIIILGWERVSHPKSKLIPSSLFAVVASVLLNEFFIGYFPDLVILPEHLVQLPEINITNAASLITLPDFSYLGHPTILKYAFIIAFVASLETLLNISATDKIDTSNKPTPPNHELIAQGLGNLSTGLIGGIPLTSVIVRSSVNINAGNKSKLSAIIHGVLLLVCVLLIPFILNKIPLGCLAAILILTGYKLCKPKLFIDAYKGGMQQFVPFLATVLGIIFTDLLMGVAIGVGVSTFFVLISNFRNPLNTLHEQYHTGETYRITLAQHLSFFNKPFISKKLNTLPFGTKLIIDGSVCDFIDVDIIHLLKEFKSKTAPKRNIEVNFIKFKEEFGISDSNKFSNILTKEIQESLSPKQVLDLLKNGNERFVSNTTIQKDLKTQVQGTSDSQFPMAAVLGCIDSRTASELIFDAGIGDVFSVRVAGNVVNSDIVASLEYATQVAGAKVIVVLGHSGCGAIRSAIKNVKMGNITGLLEKIQSSYEGIVISEEDVTLRNVMHSMKEILKTSPILKELMDEKKILIVGAVYDIETGKVNFI